MRKASRWVLTLGLMGAAPAVAAAGSPFSLISPNQQAEDAPAESETAEDRQAPRERSNQAIAEQIAERLRKARLNGYDMQIEFEGGVATLSGRVRDARHKAVATRLVSGISGVDRVENRLVPVNDPSREKASLVPDSGRGRGVRPTAFERPPAQQEAGPDNQQKAEEIAAALGGADLTGYDIAIRYQNGTAVLTGSVGNRAQRRKATQVVSEIAGVQNVQNRLQVQGGFPSAAGRPSGAYGRVRPAIPAAAGAGNQPVPQQAAPSRGMPQPPGYGPPGQGASYQVYNMPNMPSYAWPSYASYPNSAQVSYPKQYSASAWPYIGPFYPYPQVPLGWRKAELEWDDGYWSLNFHPRTQRWWWFLHPENWSNRTE